MQILSTTNEIATTKHKIGTVYWYCLSSGEPEITRQPIAELVADAKYNLAHNLGGDPDTHNQCVFVGKGAHRAARRALKRDEIRVRIQSAEGGPA